MFLVLAGAMVALVLGVIVPIVGRGLRHDHAAGGARRRAALAVAAAVLGVPALAVGLYALRGDPGALDSERSALSEQLLEAGLPAEGEASGRLYVELERHLKIQPADVRAQVLKARLDMRAQRYPQAAAAFELAMAGRSKVANDPDVWVEYAEARGMAQGGVLAGAPLQLVQRALALDAGHAQALDLAGSAAWEVRDFAKAATYWKRLLEQIPAGTSRHSVLSAAIQRAEQRARLSLPSAP